MSELSGRSSRAEQHPNADDLLAAGGEAAHQACSGLSTAKPRVLERTQARSVRPELPARPHDNAPGLTAELPEDPACGTAVASPSTRPAPDAWRLETGGPDPPDCEVLDASIRFAPWIPLRPVRLFVQGCCPARAEVERRITGESRVGSPLARQALR